MPALVELSLVHVTVSVATDSFALRVTPDKLTFIVFTVSELFHPISMVKTSVKIAVVVFPVSIDHSPTVLQLIFFPEAFIQGAIIPTHDASAFFDLVLWQGFPDVARTVSHNE